MKKILYLSMLIFVMSGSVSAQDAHLHELIQALSSENINIRDKASRELIEIYTPSMKGSLDALAKSADRELQDRAAQIIKEGSRDLVFRQSHNTALARKIYHQLSSEARDKFPRLAADTVSNKENELRDALTVIKIRVEDGQLQANVKQEDAHLILQAALKSATDIQKDWLKLHSETKKILLNSLEDYPLKKIVQENYLAQLHSLVKDEDSFCRFKTLMLLAYMDPGPKTIESARALLKDSGEDVRSQAVDVLGQLKVKEAALDIITLLGKDPEPYVRQECVRYLHFTLGSQDVRAVAALQRTLLLEKELSPLSGTIMALADWGMLDKTLLEAPAEPALRVVGPRSLPVLNRDFSLW